MERKTKIVCTIGPKSRSQTLLKRMIDAGMDAVRLNFSFGTYDWHRKAINMIRDLSNEYVGIIQDLQGPRIRIGEMNPLQVTPREIVHISQDAIPLSHPELLKDTEVGDRILIKDGAIALKITEVTSERLACRVQNGGCITPSSNVSFPDSEVSVKSLTEKDVQDLEWGLDHDVDYIALSFVKNADDLLEARGYLNEHATRAHLIAKIETRSAIANLDEIAQTADAIMVARGDLGVQFPIVQVPRLQRRIIKKANDFGKPVIVATQMLSSMVENPNPTRAEVQDISSAVLAGADAVMLSEETAIGEYPVHAIQVMAETASESERDFPHEQWMSEERIHQYSVYEAIAYSACRIISSLPETSAIISETSSGATAKRVSKFRPKEEILALTPHVKTARLLSIVWGVFPTIMAKTESITEMIQKTDEVLKREHKVEDGDLTVLTAGFPFGIGKKTNFIKVHRISERKTSM